MRESIGGTALFMIVIFFVILFTGYLCMSINQSKAFAVKNSIIRIIERYGTEVVAVSQLASSDDFKKEIKNELESVGYRSKGKCDKKDEVGFNTQGEIKEPYVICISLIKASGSSLNPNSGFHYFKVRTFYQFDIPVINEVFHWSIDGTTKAMR